MSSKVLDVRLTAHDGISAVFAKAGSGAKTLADTITQAATNASSAATSITSFFSAVGQGMQEELTLQARAGNAMAALALASEQSIRSTLSTYKQGLVEQALATATFENGLHTVKDTIIATGSAARDHANDIKTLQAEYGSATGDILAFADAMQDSTNISNDQVINAAVALGALKDQAGLTTEQIETLIARAVDLDAAIGGGVTQNAMILAQSILNATDATQAYNDALAQTAFAQGLAAQQAQGTYGELSHLKNEFQDLAVNVGDSLGVFGDFGAFIADYPTEVAIAVTATNQFAGALIALNAASVGLTGSGLLGLGAGAAGILAGPVGIAAGFAAVALLLEKYGKKGNGPTAEEVWAQTADGAEHLDTVLASLAASGATNLYNLGDAGNKSLDKLYSDFERWQALSQSVDAGSTMEDFGLTASQATGEMQDFLDTYGNFGDIAAKYAPAQNDLAMILADTGAGAGLAQAKLADLIDQFQRGELTAQNFIGYLHNLALNLGSYDVQATKAAAANQKLQTSFSDLAPTLKDIAGDVADFGYQSASAAERARAAHAAAAGGMRTVNDVMKEGLHEVIEFWKPVLDQWGKVDKLTDDFTAKWDQTRAALTGPAEALSMGFNAIVGNTNAIAQQSQALADWAENLIAAEGTYSKLDDLVKNHRITGRSGVFDDGSEYAQAQQAYNSILKDNASIQEDVLTIQAKQAPMLADMESNLAAYMDRLAAAGPEQQTFALAMADTATAQQAFDLATGILENRNVFEPMAESVANLNPMIGEALVQMGLMEKVLVEGTTDQYEYKVVANTQDAQSQLGILTTAIDALNDTLTIAVGIKFDWDSVKDNLNPFSGGGLLGDQTAGIEIPITADASAATQTIGAITDASIPPKTAFILGDETGAMQSIGEVNNSDIPHKELTIGGENGAAISAINTVNNMAVYDKMMTIDVVTRYSTIGSPSGAGYLSERHGGIPGYAHGGIPAELAEGNRAELLHFANGGVMPIFQHGIYEVPPHTYVSPSNTGTAYGGITINLDFSGAQFNNTSQEEMDRWAMERLAPTLSRVIQDARRGLPS